MRKIRRHSAAFLISLKNLALTPHFLLLSVIGNGLVFLFAAFFYHVEHGVNPLVDERMDAIWWAFTTVTTVGFGDIVPTTFLGRLIGIALMLMGTSLFACYVALISEAFLAMELEKDKQEDQKRKRV